MHVPVTITAMSTTVDNRFAYNIIISLYHNVIVADSPGFNINFENAPFKLTRDYVDLLGGTGSWVGGCGHCVPELLSH